MADSGLWRIENLDQRVVLADRAVVAGGFWRRGVGLLGRSRLEAGEGLILEPCGSIHTFGMRFAIDALHLDGEGRCLEVVGALVPWRLGPIRRGVRVVVELPAGAAAGTRVGDRIRWWPHPDGGRSGPAAPPGQDRGQQA